jgi:protocatechuate 3,4-dioxygenase beta subunit
MGRVALGLLALGLFGGLASGPPAAAVCRPTPPDALGPFYEPGAPVRTKVGTGYVLRGRVLAARTCRAIPRARIEFWLVNPRGSYDDAHRATVIAGRRGGYRFESNRPVAYESRPPHIHIRLSARGFRTLVTQHYPRAGTTGAMLNLVLRR